VGRQPEGRVTTWDVITGDCLDVLPTVQADSVVCDPPYGLEFMGKEWDAPWQVSSSSELFGKRKTAMPGWGVSRNANCKACGGRARGAKKCACEVPQWDEPPTTTAARHMAAFQEWNRQWAAAALGAVRPGGYMLAFGGTRTFHRLACAIEDAGWEIRDCIMWVYGSGFPKGKGCLKPAWEPVILARKPGPKVLPLQVDACRVATGDKLGGGAEKRVAVEGKHEGWTRPWMHDAEAVAAHTSRVRANVETAEALGRWPANVIHDGGDEVMGAFAEYGERAGSKPGTRYSTPRRPNPVYNGGGKHDGPDLQGEFGYGDTGTAARFFYCAKASKRDRGEGNTHPTVKPTELMRYLCRLITPPGGTVLDPFTGSGSTGKAALLEGFHFIGIEKEPAYAEIARRRIGEVRPTDLYAGVPA
jgi:DNA modification methylase